MMGISLAECENDVLRRKHKEIKEAVNEFRSLAKDFEQTAKDLHSNGAFAGASETLNFVVEKLENILNK